MSISRRSFVAGSATAFAAELFAAQEAKSPNAALEKLAAPLTRNGYGQYLLQVLQDKVF